MLVFWCAPFPSYHYAYISIRARKRTKKNIRTIEGSKIDILFFLGLLSLIRAQSPRPTVQRARNLVPRITHRAERVAWHPRRPALPQLRSMRAGYHPRPRRCPKTTVQQSPLAPGSHRAFLRMHAEGSCGCTTGSAYKSPIPHTPDERRRQCV